MLFPLILKFAFKIFANGLETLLYIDIANFVNLKNIISALCNCLKARQSVANEILQH